MVQHEQRSFRDSLKSLETCLSLIKKTPVCYEHSQAVMNSTLPRSRPKNMPDDEGDTMSLRASCPKDIFTSSNNLLRCLLSIGDAWLALGEFEQAKIRYQEALSVVSIHDHCYDDTDRIEINVRLGKVLLELNDIKTSKKLLLEGFR